MYKYEAIDSTGKHTLWETRPVISIGGWIGSHCDVLKEPDDLDIVHYPPLTVARAVKGTPVGRKSGVYYYVEGRKTVTDVTPTLLCLATGERTVPTLPSLDRSDSKSMSLWDYVARLKLDGIDWVVENSDGHVYLVTLPEDRTGVIYIPFLGNCTLSSDIEVGNGWSFNSEAYCVPATWFIEKTVDAPSEKELQPWRLPYPLVSLTYADSGGVWGHKAVVSPGEFPYVMASMPRKILDVRSRMFCDIRIVAL